jgi:hypothetical protein
MVLLSITKATKMLSSSFRYHKIPHLGQRCQSYSYQGRAGKEHILAGRWSSELSEILKESPRKNDKDKAGLFSG